MGDKDRIIETFAAHVSSGKAKFFSEMQMDFVPGERGGIYLKDVEGKELINAHCNGGVFNLGHRNPAVIEAVKSALDHYDIGNHHLISEPRARLAAKLAGSLPAGLEYCVFASGGGEAIDLALKLARGFTEREGVVSAEGGYHGHTGLALATGDEEFRAPFGALAPGFVQAPFNDIGALRALVSEDTAAVILETIPATLGMVLPGPGYLPAVRELCDEHGALLILDEVQSGLARTGKRWAFEHYEVAPDIVVTGKGLSGGIYPIAATVYHERLNGFFEANPFIHVSTYGGAEVGCAAAEAVLDISFAPDFLGRVEQAGERLRSGLEELAEQHARLVEEVRILGLMCGVCFRQEFYGQLATRSCYDEGLLAIYANNDKRVLQFLLPLIITDAEIDEALARFGHSLERMAALIPE